VHGEVEEQSRWSRYSIAFAPKPAALLVGTSQGRVVEIDLDGGEVFEHEAASTSVTALPDDADLETALVRHDGQRAWRSDDLAQVTHAQDDEPT
jgi:hypothetical protein